MTPGPYRVSFSGRVADQIRDVLAEAERRGVGAAALTAYESTLVHLTSNPLDCGEAREIYPAMGVRARVVIRSPLVVRFGVHEAARLVWIQSVRLRIPGRR